MAREDQSSEVKTDPLADGEAEVGDPGVQEDGCAGCCRGIFYRDGFRPSGGAVDDREMVMVAVGGGWRTDDVNVDVCEPSRLLR